MKAMNVGCDSKEISYMLGEWSGVLNAALCFVIGILCLSLGVWSNSKFLECDYLHFLQHGDWSNTAGFTRAQFTALFFGTVLLPCGLIFVVIFTIQAYTLRTKFNYGKIVLFAALTCVSLVSAYYSYDMGKDVLNCIGNFCSGTDESTATEILGAKNTLGAVYFFCSICFIALFCYVMMLSILNYLKHEEEKNNSIGEDQPLVRQDHLPIVKNSSRKNQIWIFVVVLGVLYPLMFIASISLPTWWRRFSKYELQKYEASEPDQLYGHYHKIKVNDHFYMKMYPEILYYYLSFYVVTIICVFAHYNKTLRNILHHRFNTTILYFTPNVCVGEVLLLSLLTGLLYFQFHYFYYEHKYENKNISGLRSEVELAARSLGQMANLIVGLLVLPVARNSFWTLVFGVSWESLIRYHTWLGNLFFVIVLIHMGTWFRLFHQKGYFPHDIYHVPTLYHEDNFTISLGIYIFYFSVLFIGIPSMYFIRRRSYELFYYTHHFSYVLIFMLMWHATMVWYYIAPGIVLYLVDYAIRMNNTVLYDIKVQSLTTVTSDVTVLSYVATVPHYLQYLIGYGKHMKYEVGQYCFINIPDVSQLEWHPFTISSLPQEFEVQHHIKCMGKGEWTNNLYDFARKNNYNNNVLVNVDGPYGMCFTVENYTHILLVAGGIGITPMQAHFRYLCAAFTSRQISEVSHLLKVTLVWVVRDIADAEMFLNKISDCLSREEAGIFNFRLYITQAKKHGVASLLEKNLSYNKISIFSERPNVRKVISEIPASRTSLMFACGPESLVGQCEEEAIRLGLDVKHESFLL